MTALMAFTILSLDIWTDVDINVGVLYIIVVFMTIRLSDERGVVVVALACTVLTFIGFILSPGNTWGTTAIVNRLLGLLALGFTAYLGLRDRAAQIALQESSAQLARANRVATMGELTASIAHEVKHPIASVLNNAQASVNFLRAQPPDMDELKDTLEAIVTDGFRVSDIIDRIYSLIKNEPFRKDSLNLNDVILEVLSLSRTELHKNRILVETRLASDLWRIPGDRVQLQQVLLNLILNAAEAMKDSEAGLRELEITSTNNGSNGVHVMVRDSGKGLSADDMAYLFKAFYTSKPLGMGLGLTISRSIAERHSGRLWATNNERCGATFHLWLPMSSAHQEGLAAFQNTTKHGDQPSNEGVHL
ncbi:MAG TPA: ATP-binding protein [Bradyrhizobium sp.]|nr:ATP-binding protein [Bradyrhizobium sp.]